MRCPDKNSLEGNARIAEETVDTTNKHTNGHRLLCAKMADAWTNQLIMSPCARDENALYTGLPGLFTKKSIFHENSRLIQPNQMWPCVEDN